MEHNRNKIRIIIVVLLVALISLLHYITKIGQIYYHIFYRELYFLPLVLSGFWFGLRGGLITSLCITVTHLPIIIMEWQGFSPDDFGNILEILLFNIIATGFGYISDQEKAKREAEIAAREQAESAVRLKGDFLSIMSHELRTPLVSIIGYNDLLLDGVAGKLSEEQIDALRRIDKNSKRLLELINAIRF